MPYLFSAKKYHIPKLDFQIHHVSNFSQIKHTIISSGEFVHPYFHLITCLIK